MKINWKFLIVFLCFCGFSTLVACEVEYKIFSNIPIIHRWTEPLRTWYQVRQDRKRFRKLVQEEQKRRIEKIKEAGICYEAVHMAAAMLNYGQVKGFLEIPQKLNTQGPYTKCVVKVKVGDMWMPDRIVNMLYIVMSNNGFYEVISSVPTGA